MNYARDKSFVPLVLIILQVCLLIFFAFTRLVDNDEGFYLSAGREVSQGNLPYIDFFYPQMPYLPYIFSFFAGHGFTTLYATRIASAAAAILTTLIFYLLLMRMAPDRGTRNILLAMYVFSGMIITWHSVAKPYPWADLCLLSGFYFLVRYFESTRLRYVLLCGVAAALAVNIRSVMAPVAALFLVSLVTDVRSKRLKSTFVYLAGAVIISIPAIALMLADRTRFFYDNIGFHLMRNPEYSLGQAIIQKLSVAGKLLINPQVLLLLLIGVVAFSVRKRSYRRWNLNSLLATPKPLAGMVALVITIVYFLPDPVMQQYFVQAIPFLLLASPKGIDHILHCPGGIVKFESNRKLAGALLVIYILGMIPYGVVFVGAVRDFDGFSTPGNLKKVCADLDEHPDEPILTELPMISVLCQRDTFDEAKYLGFEYALPLSEEQMEYYRLATNNQLERILESKAASHYVVIDSPPEELAPIAERNYTLDGTYDRLKVYRRKM